MAQEEQARLPVELVAVITAAISAAIDQPVGSFAIRSIQPVGAPARSSGSAWAKAGLIEAHLSRSQFASRGR